MSSTSSHTRTTTLIGGAVAVVIAIVVILAITLNSGDEQDASDVRDIQETSEVIVEGSYLPEYLGNDGVDAAVGRVAPILTGSQFDGTSITVGRGSYSLVVFLAHWCPHCQAEVPKLVDWAEALEVPAGLRVYGVSTAVTDTQPNYPPSKWLQRERFPFEVLADDGASTAGAAYGLTGYPYTVMLNSDGEVLWRHSGGFGEGELEARVATSMS